MYVLRNAVNDFLGYASNELIRALVVDNILEALEPTFLVHESAILILVIDCSYNLAHTFLSGSPWVRLASAHVAHVCASGQWKHFSKCIIGFKEVRGQRDQIHIP